MYRDKKEMKVASPWSGQNGTVWLAATSRDKQTDEDGCAVQQHGMKWKDELNGCRVAGHQSEHESISFSEYLSFPALPAQGTHSPDSQSEQAAFLCWGHETQF